jgi:hypothetical protein
VAGRLQPSREISGEVTGVAYIIAWTLGPPLSLIIIFWLLFGA